MAERGFVVELAGPPGAGKSTLVRALDGTILPDGQAIRAYDGGPRLQSFSARARTVGQALWAVGRVAAQNRRGGALCQLRLRELAARSSSLERARRRAGVWVVDEGIIQWLRSVVLREALTTDDVRRIVRSIPLPDHVICLEADPLERIQRTIQRDTVKGYVGGPERHERLARVAGMLRAAKLDTAQVRSMTRRYNEQRLEPALSDTDVEAIMADAQPHVPEGDSTILEALFTCLQSRVRVDRLDTSENPLEVLAEQVRRRMGTALELHELARKPMVSRREANASCGC